MAEMVDYDPVIREIGDPDQITLPLEYTGPGSLYAYRYGR